MLISPDGRTIKDLGYNCMMFSIEEQAKMLGLKPGDICGYLIGGFRYRGKRLVYTGKSFIRLSIISLPYSFLCKVIRALSAAWQWVKKTLHIKDKPTKRK